MASKFGATTRQLRQLMEHRGKEGRSHIDSDFGGSASLLEALQVDSNSGLKAEDTSELERRRAVFGANVIPARPPKTYIELAIEAAKDPTLIVLTAAGVISLILGVTLEEDKSVGWIEGFAIFIAVVVVINVTAFNDYTKEKQFRGLQEQIESDQRFSVLRSEQVIQLVTSEIVVGDIALFKYGDKMPADGVVLQSNDVMIDESSLTGEAMLVRKSVEKDPMLLSGTQVMEGSGSMLVTAVGLNSQSGIIFQLLTGVKAPAGLAGEVDADDAEGADKGKGLYKDRGIPDEVRKRHKSAPGDEEEGGDEGEGEGKATDEDEDSGSTKSVLQNKLTSMAVRIARFGTAAAIIAVLVLLLRFSIEEFGVKGRAWDKKKDPSIIVHAFVTGITVLVVAIPEGLPLAVTISLAYSVKKMLVDNNLVRHLHACETMGNATVICSDKTGTLTTNRMTVVRAYLAGRMFSENISSSEIPKLISDLLPDCIAVNSSYTSKILPPEREGGFPKQVGSTTECAMLGFVNNQMGKSFETIRKEHPVESFTKVFTFNSDRKSMSTVIPIENGGFRLFCKGASEILEKCSQAVAFDGGFTPLAARDHTEIRSNVVETMASNGLRTICLAYRDFTREDVEGLKSLRSAASLEAAAADGDDDEGPFDNEDMVVSHLTCLGIVGIEDPVRPEVPAAIKVCSRAGITVRMVTGDNEKTAQAIATKCGILKPKEGHVVLTGKEFNKKVRNADGNVDQALLDKVWPNLRVLARSSPADKFTLVGGIIKSKLSKTREVVAVTGDGTNDGPALKRADVGFAMGIAGTDVAKEASDIILTDDNFTSIVKAVMWGRNVYDSISKFLQFQLTVNVVAVLVALICVFAIKETPLTAVQLLWVNLIMDSFASLALATEPPVPELLNRKPYGRTKPLITRSIFRSIAGHSIYQITVMLVLVFAGNTLFDIDNGIGRELRAPATQHFTIVFNVFVLMQIFNEINSRKIHGERNVFEGFFDNLIFVFIFILTLIVQVIITEFGGIAFRTTHLSAQQWMWCIFLGCSELVINQIVVSVPKHPLPTIGNEPAIPEPERIDAKILWMRSLWRVQTQIRVVNAFRGQVDRRPSVINAVGGSSDPFAMTSPKREPAANRRSAASQLSVKTITGGGEPGANTVVDGLETDV
ncbi:plasma membrane calcium-transporting ATPase 4-like [Sycon ciliatum]|uniref:plasma membrane calcium-transporting ATPase 4-like n=1 Tax=Sycon ciliatum TaxID=27933 RepID=UPI0031F5F98E